MRRIVEIRQMKAKPKLTTLLQELKDPRLKDTMLTEKERQGIKAERRDKLRKKILALYDDTAEKAMSEHEEISKQIKVITRKYNAQWEVLESIEK